MVHQRDKELAWPFRLQKNILFVHALLGCDTTSSIYGFGKGVALHKIKTDALFREQADVFNCAVATKEEVVEAGEKALLCLYNNKLTDESLNSLRYTRFCQKVATGKSFLQRESLPPTSSAATYHSRRVYFQIYQWKGVYIVKAGGLRVEIVLWKASTYKNRITTSSRASSGVCKM